MLSPGRMLRAFWLLLQMTKLPADLFEPIIIISFFVRSHSDHVSLRT